MTVKDLQAEAKALGIKGYSKLRKAELIEAIELHERTARAEAALMASINEMTDAEEIELTDVKGPRYTRYYDAGQTLPMDNMKRINNYAAQNGNNGPLTARQNRRLNKKYWQQVKRTSLWGESVL